MRSEPRRALEAEKASRLGESGYDSGQPEKHTRQSARGEKMFVFWCVHSVMPRVLQLQGGSLGTRSRTAWVDGDDDGLQGAGLVRRGHIDMRGFLLE
jgi:hypothetical protein